MTHDEEQRDEFIAQRATVRQVELRAKLVSGDKREVSTVDDYIGGNLLHENEHFSALIVSTAQGNNAFAALMEQAIAAIAECRALKDAEQAEQDRAQDTAEYRFESMREVRRMPMYH
jgi:hypothetical protein